MAPTVQVITLVTCLPLAFCWAVAMMAILVGRIQRQRVLTRNNPCKDFDLERSIPSNHLQSSDISVKPKNPGPATITKSLTSFYPVVGECPRIINTTYSQVVDQGLSISGPMCELLDRDSSSQNSSYSRGSYSIGDEDVDYTWIGVENVSEGCGGCCPLTDCPSCQASPLSLSNFLSHESSSPTSDSPYLVVDPLDKGIHNKV